MRRPRQHAFTRSLHKRPFLVLFLTNVALVFLVLERSLISLFFLPILVACFFLFRRPRLFLTYIAIIVAILSVGRVPYGEQETDVLTIEIVKGPPIQKGHEDFTYGLGKLKGNRRLIVYGQAKMLLPGTIIQTKNDMEAAERARNPGGFSERKWAKSLGADGVIRLSKAARYTPAKSAGARLRRFIYSARKGVFDRLGESFPEALPWIAAFSGAGSSQLDPLARSKLSLLSLSHLTAVSGLHVGFMLMPLEKKRMKRRLPRRILTLIFLAWIIFLAGGSSGVLRASLMRLSEKGAREVGVELGAVEALSLAGILILFIYPFSIYQAGFWLSLLAAFGIRLFANRGKECLQKRLPIVPLSWITLISMTTIAQLFVLPILVLLNEALSPLSIVANVCLSLVAQAMTILSLLLVTLNPLMTLLPFGYVIAAAFRLPLRLLISVFDAVISLELPMWLYWLPGSVTVFHALLYLFILFFLFRYLLSGRRMMKVERPLRLTLWLLILLSFTLPFLSRLLAKDVLITYLDVGQGDAAIIEFKDDTVWLIDGGERGKGFNTIWPYMKAKGLRSIDIAFVSHGHADHAGGVIDLLELGVVKSIAVGEATFHKALAPMLIEETKLNAALSDDLSKEKIDEGKAVETDRYVESDLSTLLLHTASAHDVPLIKLLPGDTLEKRHHRLEVLPLDLESDDLNDLSLQLYFEANGVAFLFTGDATEAVEAHVLGLELPRIDVLKVAHHGSRFTTKEAFVSTYRPAIAVISVGKNPYGHPTPDVLSTLAAYGVETYRTDVHGALRLEPTDDKVSVKPWLNP